MRRTVRALAVSIIATFTVAFGLTACDSTPTAQSVCVNKITKKRVNDNRCPRSNESNLLYSWWYLTPGQRVPAVGSRAQQGTAKRPSGKVQRGGQSRTGGILKKSSSGSGFKNSGGSKSGSGSRSGGGYSGGSRGR